MTWVDLRICFPTDDSKPLIILGYDECIFKQFCMSKKSWVGLHGKTNIVPKDDGLGMMISAFQSREFDFGLDITEEELKKVNKTWKGQKYQDITAATEVSTKKQGLKPSLTNLPFVRWFKYGAGNKDYWNIQHMVLHLENCVDIIKVLNPDFDLFSCLIMCVDMTSKKEMG